MKANPCDPELTDHTTFQPATPPLGIGVGITTYDGDGNPLTTNFADYPVISAAELPSFERRPHETPSPITPLGAKGIGEPALIPTAMWWCHWPRRSVMVWSVLNRPVWPGSRFGRCREITSP